MTSKTPAQLAKQWFLSNCAILDTETTGLGDDAEVCEISIIDIYDNVLFSSLVKPTRSIPADATAIHGITDEMVADAPCWFDIQIDVLAKLGSCETLVIYNASYDLRLIEQTMYMCGSDNPVAIRCFNKIKEKSECAMLAYAEYYGDWNEYHENYRWQRLTSAADQQGVVVAGKAHRALSDCFMTSGLIRAMAKGA